MIKRQLEEEWAATLDALRAGKDAIAVFGALRDQDALRCDEAQALWQLHLQAGDRRRAGGVYYTSAEAAAPLLQRAIAALEAPPVRVLEPSCGGGRLVSATITALTSHFGLDPRDAAARIDAYELDATGLWLAQWQVASTHGEAVSSAVRWRQGDTLEAAELRDARFDLIVGNPPFGNAIHRSTRRSDDARRAYRARFPLAARGAFDKCSLFVELASALAGDDAIICYILPQSWLAQPASDALREALGRGFAVREILAFDADAFFDAQVSTIGITLRRRQGDRRPAPTRVGGHGETRVIDMPTLFETADWGAALHPFTVEVQARAHALVRLDAHVELSAGATTDEAYAWQAHIEELAAPSAHGAAPTHTPALDDDALRQARDAGKKPLVIAGMIDPFELRWGTLPTRYLGADYARPMIAVDALAARRGELSNRPRALLPTLSRVLEAWPDLRGEVVGAVSTIAAWPRARERASERETLLLAAMLNSAWCRLSYAALFSALALHGGNTQVTKKKLGRLLIPRTWGALLDTPREAPPPPLDDALYRQLHADLAALELPFYKDLLRRGDFERVREVARCWQVDAPASTTIALLEALLHQDPRAALKAGAVDVLLMALAPELL